MHASSFSGDIAFWRETEALELLYQKVVDEKSIRRDTIDFWHHSFIEWMKKNERGDRFSLWPARRSLYVLDTFFKP